MGNHRARRTWGKGIERQGDEKGGWADVGEGKLRRLRTVSLKNQDTGQYRDIRGGEREICRKLVRWGKGRRDFEEVQIGKPYCGGFLLSEKGGKNGRRDMKNQGRLGSPRSVR